MQPTTAPPPDDPTAVLGRRIFAFLIDGLIGMALLFLFIVATFTNTSFDNDADAQLQCELIYDISTDVCIVLESTVYVGDSGETAVGLVFIGLGWVLLSTMVIPGFTGWSPGKLVTGLRIVNNETFEPAGIWANIGRGFLWVADAFPYCCPLVGLIVGVSAKGHRRLGDMVSNTLVIDRSHVGSPVAIPGANTLVIEPAPDPAEPAPDPAEPAPDPAEPAAEPLPAPGVVAPMWDAGRSSYIQWDPRLVTWVEWNQASGRWIPIPQ